MNEKPILFSPEMVRAILEGRKTQTRRVMKPQPEANDWIDTPMCQYGHIGDLLWVRETWGTLPEYDSIKPSDLPNCPIYYNASQRYYPFSTISDIGKKRPSIFMPRWASRITLMVTNVRVERVQDISEEDAIAEGIQRFDYGADSYKPEYCTICFGTQELALGAMHTTAKGAFSRLWDSINSKRGYSWASNPWVWIIEFERMVIGASDG